MRQYRDGFFLRRLMLSAAGAAILGSVGCARHEREAWSEASSGEKRDPATVMVTAAPVTFQPVQRTVEAVGTLYGYEEVTLSTKVEGRVLKILHEVGDRVKPGEPLLEVDPTDYELSGHQAERGLEVELAKLGLKELPDPKFDVTEVPTVVQARVRMENTKLQLDRIEKLAAQHAVSEEERTDKTAQYRSSVSDYETQLLQARSGLATIKMKQESLAMAQQQLKDVMVLTPVPSRPVPQAGDGVRYAITQRIVAEGTYVRSGAEVFKLVIEKPLKLRVPVPERHEQEVHLDQNVEVSTAGFRRTFAGKIIRINPAIDPVTRTFEVEIQLPNQQGELKPGGFAKATILTRLDQEAATVPLEALTSFAGVTKIFLIENKRARDVPITPGVQTTSWVEIRKPALDHGAQVITSGQSALADGTPVEIRSP